MTFCDNSFLDVVLTAQRLKSDSLKVEQRNCKLIKYHNHSPRLTMDIFPFPVAAQDIFFSAQPHPGI